jgi:hypothetical protein
MDYPVPPHLLYLHFCLCLGTRNAKLVKKQGKTISKMYFDFDNSSSPITTDDIESSS